MSHYTKRDILRLVEEEDVEFIRLQFADLFGNLKNAAVTAGQLERVLDQGYVFDGSCVEGFLHDNDMDMFLWPDLDTLAIFFTGGYGALFIRWLEQGAQEPPAEFLTRLNAVLPLVDEAVRHVSLGKQP